MSEGRRMSTNNPCGTAVTAIADRAYRTTGYNYGANRFDGVVSC